MTRRERMRRGGPEYRGALLFSHAAWKHFAAGLGAAMAGRFGEALSWFEECEALADDGLYFVSASIALELGEMPRLSDKEATERLQRAEREGSWIN